MAKRKQFAKPNKNGLKIIKKKEIKIIKKKEIAILKNLFLLWIRMILIRGMTMK